MPVAWDLEHVLPSYTPPSTRRTAPPEVEHCYHLTRDGRPLVTLTVKSGAADADITPVMRQGYTITGNVTLDVQEGMQVRAIDLQVRLPRCSLPRCLSLWTFPYPDVPLSLMLAFSLNLCLMLDVVVRSRGLL